MRRGLDAKVIVLGSLIAGFAVGVVDGLHAGSVVGVGAVGTLASAGLAGAVDLLLATALAVFAVTVAALFRWGRRGLSPSRARHIAWFLLGLGAAYVTALAIVVTVRRKDRFLVAGVVALDALAAAVLAALLAPALARALSPVVRRLPHRLLRPFARKTMRALGARLQRLVPAPMWRLFAPKDDPEEVTHQLASFSQRRGPSWGGLLLLAPLVALLLDGLVFLLLWRTPAALLPPARIMPLVLVGLLVLLMPAALSWAALQLGRIPLRIAGPISAVLFGGGAIWLVRESWALHLQFVPWRDLRIIAFVVLASAAAVITLARTGPRGWKRALVIALAPPAALGLALLAGSAEKARKATAAAGGLVGPLLGLVRPALDFDHDGYPGLLGGGDCADHDPKVNPGALDWPEDGVDQDCDGSDLRAADLRPPPLAPMPSTVPRELNVVVIVIDSLRADHVGAYGYQRPTTPQIDRLAREGTVFENAWAHSPSTHQSMPALISGRWPSAIKWDTSISWPGIARGQRTIAEVLRGAGYFNGAFYAHSYFNRGDARGFERAVDQYDDRLAAKHINVDGPTQSRGTSSREMADDGIDFLRAYRDQKFFLTLHFFDPHLSYQPHSEAPSFGKTPGDLYDGEIWFTDKHVGRVLAALHDLGIYDRTAVVITADHGEALGEHGAVAHGAQLHPPETKVPLIVRVPGLPAKRVAAPVGHVDLAPTLVNLTRAGAEPGFLGRSLVDLMAGTSGAAPPPEAVFQEVSFVPTTPLASSSERRALVTATHHLIWNAVPENAVYCYDLQADPGERHDLWGLPAGEAVCPGLKRALDRRLSLLKLADLPFDFAQRLEEGVSRPGQGASQPAPQVARLATFGNRVVFKGFDIQIPGAPFPSSGPPPQAPAPGASGPGETPIVRIARGGELSVTTHFEVHGDLSGWEIFFHLDGPGGTWRNLDHTPVGGAYPVERWREGQAIRDRFTIRFGASEAPGLHTLAIGFWQPPASRRRRLAVAPAAFQDGADRLRVVTFQVE
jgi:arylsulfatase A-like enzyme